MRVADDDVPDPSVSTAIVDEMPQARGERNRRAHRSDGERGMRECRTGRRRAGAASAVKGKADPGHRGWPGSRTRDAIGDGRPSTDASLARRRRRRRMDCQECRPQHPREEQQGRDAGADDEDRGVDRDTWVDLSPAGQTDRRQR